MSDFNKHWNTMDKTGLSHLLPSLRVKRSDPYYDPDPPNDDKDYLWTIGIGLGVFFTVLVVILCCLCSRWTAFRKNKRGEWVTDASSPFYMAGVKPGGYDNLAYTADGKEKPSDAGDIHMISMANPSELSVSIT